MVSNLIPYTEQPNHNLSYTVGIDFCLEDMYSLPPNMSVECSLGNEPDPLPEFTFTVELLSNSTNSSTEILQMQISADSILQLNETALLSLFKVDTAFVMITCIVSNSYGSDHAITIITICGT